MTVLFPSNQTSTPVAVVGSGVGRIANRLTFVVHLAASILLAVEIVLLFAGVFSRYVLNRPLIWSDELASILFLWLAMFGTTIAFSRGKHMRMTSLSERAQGRTKLTLEALSIIVPLVFVAILTKYAVHYAYEESWITTPALGLSNAWRAAALPVGGFLMCAFGILQLLQIQNRKILVLAAILFAAFVLVLLTATPLYGFLGKWNLVLFFVAFVGASVFAGVPIAFCFGMATVGYLALTTRTPLIVMVGRVDEGMSHLILLAIPLFIFLGLLMEATGMARVMLAFLSSLVGHLRGGLSYVLVGAMYLVSGISGSKTADMAAIAPALIPEMKARGEKPGELTALLAATGAQTETIPPSLALIAISSAAGVSISALFIGGLVPALVVGIVLCTFVWWRNRGTATVTSARPPWAFIAKSFAVALPAILLPFVIRAAVVEGAATATEVSTIGVAYALLASLLFYDRVPLRRLFAMMVDTASLAGSILFIVGTATAMAWALTQSGFSRDLALFMSSLPGGAITFMIASIVIFVIIGSVLEGIPAIVLLAPLLLPVAKQIGIHEVHYSMVAILSMGVGYFAPPFGIGYYTACAIADVHPNEAMKPILGFILALLIGIGIVAAFPWLSIGLL
jgi:tripartite ATP-independent transporter DctM subunit